VASPQWHPGTDLEESATPPDPLAGRDLPRLGFFGLVALLERLTPSSARVGGPSEQDESIRFRHDPSLGFSVQDVSAVRTVDSSSEIAPGRKQYEVTTTFLGLAGGSSPTPAYVSEEVLRQEGTSLQDFLDLFHHRLISLFYRELARFKPWAEQTSTLNDAWSSRLLALAGLDAYSTPLPANLSPSRLLRLLPLMARRTRSSQELAVALEEVLDEVIAGAKVSIREFTGGWSPVPRPERTQLGMRNSQLGQNALLGDQVRDPAGAFEVHIGPISRERFRELSDPHGPIGRVHSLVGVWVRDPLEYRVVVHLPPDQVPSLRLGDSTGGRLGCDTWLGRRSTEAAVTVYPAVGAA